MDASRLTPEAIESSPSIKALSDSILIRGAPLSAYETHETPIDLETLEDLSVENSEIVQEANSRSAENPSHESVETEQNNNIR